MNFDEYQKAVKRTAAASPTAVFALGLAGEVGEVIEPIKKNLDRGRPIDSEKMAEEIGDVLWYLTALTDSLGLTMLQIAEKNVAKLNARYPDGWKMENK